MSCSIFNWRNSLLLPRSSMARIYPLDDGCCGRLLLYCYRWIK
nr:MAG TPA: hypothetical protein [Caudoviricetes sp.]